MGCHAGVSMHDGFRWLDCDSAHMRTQKCNWDYRGSKPDREPKRSDARGENRSVVHRRHSCSVCMSCVMISELYLLL